MINKAARNEQRKLSATFLNGLAIAIAAIGGFTPLIVSAQNVAAGQVTAPPWFITLVILVCIVVSVALHWSGRQLLARIEE